MRLRWITILSTLVLKLCLLGAMFLLGRMVIERDYATLEREHISADIAHVCVVLQSQLNDFDLMAHDYAAWDETYSFMRHPNPGFVESELSSDVMKKRSIRLFLLVDERFHVVLSETYSAVPADTLNADIAQLIRAVKRRGRQDSTVVGLLTLTNGPTMVAIRPIVPTRENRAARGTLVLVRDLGVDQVSSLSRLSALPLTLSGTVGEASEILSRSQITHSGISIVSASDDHLSAATMLRDLWGQSRIRLEMQHDHSIWRQGQQTIRALMVVLIAVGLLFGSVNVWLMQAFVVRRVERLIQFTGAIENDGTLGARVSMRGSDEIAQLGVHLNKMLERLQNSQDKLLSVQERLRYEATHDALTGIWNRGAALQLLDQELARSSRDNSSVAVIMFDADHFKRINDHFGHSTGDHALQAIAAAITRNLRSFDVCCRYGGEEFLVIAPNCDLSNAAQLANRILAHLRSTPVSVPDHSFCLTLSAGVTAGSSLTSAEDLILVADRALYRAKDTGRDRVEVEEWPSAAPIRSVLFASDGLDCAAS